MDCFHFIFYSYMCINISNLAVPILEISMSMLNRLLHTFNIFEHRISSSRVWNTNKETFQMFPSVNSESWANWENTQRLLQLFFWRLRQIHFISKLQCNWWLNLFSLIINWKIITFLRSFEGFWLLTSQLKYQWHLPFTDQTGLLHEVCV